MYYNLNSVKIQVWQITIWLFWKHFWLFMAINNHTMKTSISVLLWRKFDSSQNRKSLKFDLYNFHKLFVSCFLNLEDQTAMKNLALIIAMSLGLFALGTFANSDPPKAMYKRLPLSFKDNGELRCPGSKIRGPRKDLLTKNLLNRFGITVATRFQVICS